METLSHRSKHSILIIDDEQPTIDSLELLLGEQFQLIVARSGEEGLEKIRRIAVDLVFLDISLPGMDGFEVLSHIKQYDSTIDVVMLTADEKAKTAMKAMELGAFHYITKPYDKEDIFLVTSRVFEKKKMADEIIALRDEVESYQSFHSMIGQHPKMKEIFKIITKLAATDSTVLITGESGTGKELVAKAIYQQSVRKDGHFKAMNCGAIPEHLLESELFGHERGAFTGATERKIGKFEMADRGTLFLDEISAMKEGLQVKLLRVLQEHEIERVGGIKSIPIDVRIIAATNSDLKKLVEKGDFREDLYFRINVIHLHLPPLRERKSDIPLLSDYFLNQFAQKFHKRLRGFSNGARQVLEGYGWPGNVRELRNVIERAVVLCDGDLIDKEHLPLELSIPACDIMPWEQTVSLKSIMDSYEKKVIINILERVSWNQTKAAALLGIHRNTLLMKLEALDIRIKELKQENENKVFA